MPRLGTADATGPLGEYMGGLTSTMQRGVQQMADSVTFKNLAEGLTGSGRGPSTDSSLLDGVGSLIGGFGKAWEGMSATNQALLTSMLGQKNGGGGDQNQLMMFMLLMQVMQQANQTKDSSSKDMMDILNTTWKMLWERERENSGPSPADQTLHQYALQSLGTAMAKIHEPPPDPITSLLDQAGKLKALQTQIPGFLGGGEQYGPGFLTAMQTQAEVQKVLAGHEAQKQNLAVIKDIVQTAATNAPQLVQNFAMGAIQVAAALGMVPGVQPGMVVGAGPSGTLPPPQQPPAQGPVTAEDQSAIDAARSLLGPRQVRSS